MKYGYVKYTDKSTKSDIWDKEQVRNVFEKSGNGRGMGKDFFENEVWVREQTTEELCNVQNSTFDAC